MASTTNTATAANNASATAEGTNENLLGHYKLEKTIGQGTYGKVKLARDTRTGEKVAVKVLEKANIKSEKQVARIQREIRFLKLLHHPHIVKVYDVMETSDYIFIVMEYAIGGELFNYIVTHKRVKEKEARWFFRQILSAVDYCHTNAVIHRDLKPENLLLDADKSIKIIDFGFGNTYKTDGFLETFCGSPFYASPEMILGRKYEGPEVDMWSLGIILFALLCGFLPFDDENMKDLYKKIASASYQMPEHLPGPVKQLIRRMITVDPRKRATLEEVKNHPWVREGYDGPPDNLLPKRPLLRGDQLEEKVIQRLISFGYKEQDIRQAFDANYDEQQVKATDAASTKDSSVGTGEQPAAASNSVKKPETKKKVDPIITTYHLLNEMLQRDADVRKVTQKQQQQKQESAEVAAEKEQQISREADITSTVPPTPLPVQPQQQHSVDHGRKLSLQIQMESSKVDSANKLTIQATSDAQAKGSQPTSNLAAVVEGDVAEAISNSQPPQPQSNRQGRQARLASLQVGESCQTKDHKPSSKAETTAPIPLAQYRARQAGDNTASSMPAGINQQRTTNERAIRSSGPNDPSEGSDKPSIVSGPASPATTQKMQWRSQNELTSPLSPGGNGSIGGVASRLANSIRSVFNRPGSVNNVSTSSAPVSPIVSKTGPLSPVVSQAKHHRRNPTALPSMTNSNSESNENNSNHEIDADTTNESAGPRRTSDMSAQEVRSVSGWFLNVSTTSTKPPGQLIEQVINSLKSLESSGVKFDRDQNQSPWVVNVEVQTAEFMQSTKDAPSKLDSGAEVSSDEISTLDEETKSNASNSNTMSNGQNIRGDASGIVTFQIEICKVPKLNLHGLYFKRLNGSIWSYKKICGRLLPYLKL